MQPFQALIGYSLGTAIAAISFRARLLSNSGAVGAAIVGGTVFAFGGWQAGAALLTFFLTSSLLGKWRKNRKENLGYDKGGRRDIWQVLANGGVAAAALAIGALIPAISVTCKLAFIAALAEANADTWATEIGSASNAIPRLITTGKPAPPGMSGAVSLQGTAASLAGSLLIALFGTILLPSHHARYMLIVGLSGLAGALFDSVLGATIQVQYFDVKTSRYVEQREANSTPDRGIAGVDNDMVNTLSTIFAAALAITCQYLLPNTLGA